MLAGPTLIEDLPASPEARSAPIIACGEAKSLRPTCPIQRPAALGLGAVEADELGHRQTGLRCFSTAAGWSTGWGSWPWRGASGGNRGNLRLQSLKSRDFGLRFDANQVILYSNTRRRCALKSLSTMHEIVSPRSALKARIMWALSNDSACPSLLARTKFVWPQKSVSRCKECIQCADIFCAHPAAQSDPMHLARVNVDPDRRVPESIC